MNPITEFQKVTLTDEEIKQCKNTAVGWVQKWLNVHTGSNLVIDGVFGNASQSTFLEKFTNKNAVAITEPELKQLSEMLGTSNLKYIRAVASVESAGSGWDKEGLVKILYERHKFFQFSMHKKITIYCSPKAGGYDINSWTKLLSAISVDPLSALKSISIGKFQVMGMYYKDCGYSHPIEMLYDSTRSELAQYQLLVSYILNIAHIKNEFLSLCTEPEKNKPFARAYNGKNFENNKYHIKLAQAMK